MAQQKETGFCKFFNTEKGFGFITPDAGGDDLFVHQTSIHAEGFRSLAEGEKVEYDREMNHEKGKEKAVNVTGPGGVHVQGQPKQQSYDRGYNDRGNNRGYSDRGNSRGYNDQNSRGYNNNQNSGYNNQNSRGYSDQNSGYGNNQGYNNQQY